MESYPTRESSLGKVLHCKDCGAQLILPKNSLSVSCNACGNIEFLGKVPPQNRAIEMKAESILSRRLISQLLRSEPRPETQRQEIRADGSVVEELIFRYQVEWQLWAVLVDHFDDPNYHMAYLSLLSHSLDFSLGIKRYQAHSKVMANLAENRWQSELCDRQMELLRKLSVMQFERELQRPVKGLRLPRSAELVLSFTAGLLLIVHFFAH